MNTTPAKSAKPSTASSRTVIVLSKIRRICASASSPSANFPSKTSNRCIKPTATKISGSTNVSLMPRKILTSRKYSTSDSEPERYAAPIKDSAPVTHSANAAEPMSRGSDQPASGSLSRIRSSIQSIAMDGKRFAEARDAISRIFPPCPIKTGMAIKSAPAAKSNSSIFGRRFSHGSTSERYNTPAAATPTMTSARKTRDGSKGSNQVAGPNEKPCAANASWVARK